MPRISGRELATRLTAARAGLKVLYISGYTDDSIFRHGVLEGGMSFLQKPFNLKAIAQKVREVLDGVPEHADSSWISETITKLGIESDAAASGGKTYKIMTVWPVRSNRLRQRMFRQATRSSMRTMYERALANFARSSASPPGGIAAFFDRIIHRTGKVPSSRQCGHTSVICLVSGFSS